MEWMDRWMHRGQDHSVKERQSLDCGQPGTAPQATNLCQCSQPQDQREYRARVPEDQDKHTHAPAFHTLFSPCCSIVQSLHPSPPHLHRQSCQWGSSCPRRGVVKRLESSKSPNEGFWPVGTDFITVATWAFELENALKNKSWRTTWWYCVTTKNCSN